MAQNAVAGKLVWDVSLNATKFTKEVSDSKGAMTNLASFATGLVGSFNPVGFALSAIGVGAKLMFGGVKMVVSGLASLATMAVKAAFAMTKWLAGAIWGVIRAATKAVAVVGGMLAGALAGAGGFSLYKALNMASEAGDAAARFVLVFGNAAKETDAKVAAMAQTLGRSRFAMRDMVASLGLTITGLGVGQRQAAGMSVALAEMAANMAEVAGGTIEEAMDAIMGGFTGNTRALRRFGIVIDEADIASRAFAMGLAKTKEDLTDAARAQAVMAILTEKTARMQGAAAGGVADYDGQLDKLKGTIRDMTTEIGQRLMPKAAAFLKWVNDTAVPFVRGLVDKFFTDWGPRMGEWLGNVVGEVAKWMKVIWSIVTQTWGMIAKWVKDVLKGWGVDTESFGSGVAGVISLLTELAQGAFEKARRFAANFKLYIDYWAKLIQLKFQTMLEEIKHMFSWGNIGQWMKHMFRQLMGLIGAFVNDALEGLAVLAMGFQRMTNPQELAGAIGRNLMAGRSGLDAAFGDIVDLAMNRASHTLNFQPEAMPQGTARTMGTREFQLKMEVDKLKEQLDAAMNAPLPPGLDDEAMKNLKDKIKDLFKNLFTFSDLPGLPEFTAPAASNGPASSTEQRKSSFTAMSDAWKKVQEQIVLRGKEQRRDNAIHSTAKSAADMVSLLREIREIQRGTKEKISTWADEMLRDNMQGVLAE